jgi:hypothetical protein
MICWKGVQGQDAPAGTESMKAQLHDIRAERFGAHFGAHLDQKQ